MAPKVDRRKKKKKRRVPEEGSSARIPSSRQGATEEEQEGLSAGSAEDNVSKEASRQEEEELREEEERIPSAEELEEARVKALVTRHLGLFAEFLAELDERKRSGAKSSTHEKEKRKGTENTPVVDLDSAEGSRMMEKVIEEKMKLMVDAQVERHMAELRASSSGIGAT